MIPPNFNIILKSCASCCHCIIGDIDENATCEILSEINRGNIPSLETRRKISAANSGENHPNWQGGKSFEPYCNKFDDPFKMRVRTYFNHKCVECGKTNYENGRNLDVHHVIYDKGICCNGDDVKDRLFVPLCVSCHSKTKTKDQKILDYYQERYTNLINTAYSGKCYYTKEEYYKLFQQSIH